MTSTRTRSRSSWRTATSATLALLLAAAAAAGAGAPEGSPGEPYRIGPGDVVDVQVWREPDLSGSYRIDEAGRLQHVLLGAVEAAERTTDELAAHLKQRLERDYLREARVIVTLKSSARRKAWILGAVVRPGSYPVRDDTRLLDLVFAAGGLAADSTGRGELYRDDSRSEVDLSGLLGGDLTANRDVVAGDVLVVGAGGAAVAAAPPARIRVVGEVQRPGSYALAEAPTALDAVLAAGGFTDYAAANRARLVRGAGESRRDEEIRLEDVVRGREGSTNVELRDGDLIVVPESFF